MQYSADYCDREVTAVLGMRWPAIVALCVEQLDSDYDINGAELVFDADDTTIVGVIVRPHLVHVSYAGGHPFTAPPVVTFAVNFTPAIPRATSSATCRVQPQTPPRRDRDRTPPRRDRDRTPPRRDRSRTPPRRDRSRSPRTPRTPQSEDYPFRISYAYVTPPYLRAARGVIANETKSEIKSEIKSETKCVTECETECDVPSSPQIPCSQMPRARSPLASPLSSPPESSPAKWTWPSSASSDGYREAYISLETVEYRGSSSSSRLMDELAELCTP
jgi:hypothetical protein